MLKCFCYVSCFMLSNAFSQSRNVNIIESPAASALSIILLSAWVGLIVLRPARKPYWICGSLCSICLTNLFLFSWWLLLGFCKLWLVMILVYSCPLFVGLLFCKLGLHWLLWLPLVFLLLTTSGLRVLGLFLCFEHLVGCVVQSWRFPVWSPWSFFFRKNFFDG